MEINWSKFPLATHYTPARDSHFAGFWKMSGDKAITLWCLELKDETEAVQYDNPTVFYLDLKDMIPRPVSEWSGEGLPPAGTVCEIGASTQYLKIRYPEGAKVKVYANFTDDRGVELAAFVDEIGQMAGVCTEKCFRPIRTPEQIAAEARSIAVSEIIRAIGWNHDTAGATEAAERVYSAGYRKQVTE